MSNTNTWRTKDWKNPYIARDYPDRNFEKQEVIERQIVAYEAGADAMLEVLKKGGKYWNYKENLFEDEFGLHPISIPIVDIKNKKGWLVFIPEEETK